MFKAVIFEDNQDNIDILHSFISEIFPQIEIVGIGTSLKECEQLIRLHKIDIAFVDIELKDGTSLDVLSKFLPLHFQVIFITAFEQQASKIIRYAAVDYLLKPIDIKEFTRSVNTALQQINDKMKLGILNRQMEYIDEWRNKEDKYPERIIIHASNETVFLKVGDIVRCDAQGSYCEFTTVRNEKILTSKPLKDYEDLLDPLQFIRVHKSHIINKSFAVKYLKEDGVVVMEDGSKVMVSRRNKDFLLQNMI